MMIDISVGLALAGSYRVSSSRLSSRGARTGTAAPALARRKGT